jgi:hypothetical protein
MAPAGPPSKVRTLQSIIDAFHASVGSNCVLELGMAVDHTGLVPVAQVIRANEFGAWKTACYGKPAGLAPTAAVGDTILTITLPKVVLNFVKFSWLSLHCSCHFVSNLHDIMIFDDFVCDALIRRDDTSTTK